MKNLIKNIKFFILKHYLIYTGVLDISAITLKRSDINENY